MEIPVEDHDLFTSSFAIAQAVLGQGADDLKFTLKRLYREYERWELKVSLE